MSIERLTEWEDHFILKFGGVSEVDENRKSNFSEKVLCEENRAIYEQYILLISRQPAQVEALKRAVFLQWYAVSEPPYLSFLSGLKPELQRIILNKVQGQIENKKLDNEFEHMLSWYYFISDWYFDSFSDLPILVEHLENISSSLKPLEYLKRSDFNKRGQMGIYWQSLLKQ
jgi:hypothetical protein